MVAKLVEPRKEAEWNIELAEAIAIVCRRWGGTVLLPCIGVGQDALVDLRDMYGPLGLTVLHSIGGSRAMLAERAGRAKATPYAEETLTFKAAVP